MMLAEMISAVVLIGQWIIPDITGQCMPPNEAFVMESINNTRAIIFGGAVEGSPSNSLFIVDIINNTVVSYFTLTISL